MGYDGWDEDVSVPKCLVFEILVVNRIDGRKNLLLQFFLDVCVRFELVEIMVIGAVSGCNLCGGSVDSMDRLRARMIGCVEWCASSEKVCSVGHDDAEMTVDAASTIRMEGSCIGIDFLLELADGSGGWLAQNGS